MNIYFYLMLFFLYSISGWIIELIDLSVIEKRLVKNRGFLIGPYCPIYGFGALLMTLFLTRYSDDLITLFFMAMLLTSALEYFTSILLEKLFKARWWDYSNMGYNINGRVLLINSLGFGFFGLLLIHYINPFLLEQFNKFNMTVFKAITLIFLILFATDAVLSIMIMFKLRSNAKMLKGDSSIFLSKKVKKELSRFGIFKKRIFNAFPNINFSNNKALKNIKIFLDKNFKK